MARSRSGDVAGDDLDPDGAPAGDDAAGDRRDEVEDREDRDERDEAEDASAAAAAAGPLPPPLGVIAIVVGFVAAQILGALAYVPLVMAGWDLYAPGGDGAALGQVAGNLAVGRAPEVTRSLADLPLWAYFLAQLPFWLGFLVPAVAIVWYRYGPRGVPALGTWIGLRFKPVDVPVGLAVGIASQLVMVQGLYWVVFRFIGDQDVSAEARRLTDRATDGWAVLALVVVVGIAAPLVEELYFRGLTMPVIERRWGATVGVIGSSLYFAGTHFQTLQFPALLVFGVILAWLVHRTGRLGPAIVAHLAFNLTTVVLLVFGIGL
ncbi:MAG: type II CAAX endopeptidase family protein [Acidimicrobiales bacterium]